MSSHSNPTGRNSHRPGPLSNESQTGQEHVPKQEPVKRRTLKKPSTKASTQQPLLGIKVPAEGKVSFSIEGNGETDYFVAEDLTLQEAVKLVTELTKGKVSVGFGEGNGETGSFVAKDLTPQEAKKLVTAIKQGKLNLKELSEQGWREDKGELTGVINSVVELADETTISVAAGLMGGFLVAFFGPVGGILTGLGLAAMEKTIQKNYSVAAGLMGGELFTLTGPVGAILIPLGAGFAMKLLPD